MRKIRCNLKKLLNDRGWEQKKLAEITEIREATISEMCRDSNKMFPRSVLEKIVEKLDLDDINELISIVEEPKDEKDR